jgi:hypothetical protein
MQAYEKRSTNAGYIGASAQLLCFMTHRVLQLVQRFDAEPTRH